MENSGVKKMDRDSYIAPVKLALDFLPENERPSFEEFVKRYKQNLENFPNVKQNFKGHNLLPSFSAKSAEHQYKHWKPKQEDVLISTYPKSGTTWMSEIMRHILYKNNEEETKIASVVTQPFIYLESFDPVLYEAYQKFSLKRRLYATHMTSECLNMERILKSGCKVICVLRNPKDQLVSWYNFIMKLPRYDEGLVSKLFPPAWNDFFDSYITGQQPTFCQDGEWYPHHILSWYPYRNHKNVKFIYFEDLKKNTSEKLKEISHFVESERTNKETADIARDTSLNKMKTGRLSQTMVFGKGNVGDWKKKFTVAQSEMMDEKMNKILSETDIKFTFEL